MEVGEIRVLDGDIRADEIDCEEEKELTYGKGYVYLDFLQVFLPPTPIQYIFLKLENWAIIPPRTRARRTPISRPESTIAMDVPRLFGRARSAARGIKTFEPISFLCVFVDLAVIHTCGVTDEIATKKDKISKPTIDFVSASPTERDPDVSINTSKSCRRRIKSPRGERKTRPTAYL